MVMEAYQTSITVWGMSPEQFWALFPTEWWWQFDARRPAQYGGMDEETVEGLYQLAMKE